MRAFRQCFNLKIIYFAIYLKNEGIFSRSFIISCIPQTRLCSFLVVRLPHGSPHYQYNWHTSLLCSMVCAISITFCFAVLEDMPDLILLISQSMYESCSKMQLSYMIEIHYWFVAFYLNWASVVWYTENVTAHNNRVMLCVWAHTPSNWIVGALRRWLMVNKIVSSWQTSLP